MVEVGQSSGDYTPVKVALAFEPMNSKKLVGHTRRNHRRKR